jgi:hypothetical protein
VSSGNRIKSILQCLFEKAIKLHEIIAKDIRVWCESFLVPFIDIAHDTTLILFAEIERIKGKSKIFRNFPSFLDIHEGRTIRRVGNIVDHESARYFMPSLFQ